MKIVFTVMCSFWSLLAVAQPSSQKPLRVLFIGNSYTYYHNMPQIVTGIAASMGNVLVTDQSTVGGYTLRQHTANTTTLSKITQGTPDYNNQKARSSWDYVVIQEHSQLPSNPREKVSREVEPYVSTLDSTIHTHNPTAQLIFYQTWGRKNGDSARCADWNAVCTYEGMDSLTATTYRDLAQKHAGLLAPVGAVWKYLREHHPTLELYSADESHPSEAGSYAAACCFYTVLFNKNPADIPYNYTLNSTDATRIREAVKAVIFDTK